MVDVVDEDGSDEDDSDETDKGSDGENDDRNEALEERDDDDVWIRGDDGWLLGAGDFFRGLLPGLA